MTREALIAYLRTCPEPPEVLTGAYCIYALVDQRDFTVGYVGTSHLPAFRMETHLKLNDKNHAKIEWLRSVLASGVQPRMLLLEIVPGADDANLARREQAWMQHALEADMPLTNQERAFKELRDKLSRK